MISTRGWVLLLGVSCFSGVLSTLAQARSSSLDTQARQILTQNCFRCHGQDGDDEGGYGSVIDFDNLESQEIIVAGKPDDSELIQRVRKGSMPPGRNKLDAATVTFLEKWVTARGAQEQAPSAPAKPAREDDVISDMFVDLATLDRDDQKFVRYITLNHLANQGINADSLKQYETTLAFLLNSLSFEADITAPKAVNAAHTVFRIDLRDYSWDADRWNVLVENYPYSGLVSATNSRDDFLSSATGAKIYSVRADWFIENASRAPLYYKLMGFDSEANLAETLGVDFSDIEAGKAPRAGFDSSGVSHNNRVIERHKSKFGYYWRSYDFKDSLGTDNIFTHPLDFTATAGEAVFSLPNGLQGYLVVNGAGGLVDKADTTIVSDVHRPDRAVIPGLSCMSCHGAVGIIPKDDQIRARISQTNSGFDADAVAQALKLYVPRERFAALVQKDGHTYQKVISTLNLSLTDDNPITNLANSYEAPIGASKASAEMDLTLDELRAEISTLPSADGVGVLGALLSQNGSVPRDAFETSFADLIKTRTNYLAGVTVQIAYGTSLAALHEHLHTKLTAGSSQPVVCGLLCTIKDFDPARPRFQEVIAGFDSFEDLDADTIISALKTQCSDSVDRGIPFKDLSFDTNGAASLVEPTADDADLPKNFCEHK